MNDLQLISLVAETDPYPRTTPLLAVARPTVESLRGLDDQAGDVATGRTQLVPRTTQRARNQLVRAPVIAALSFLVIALAIGLAVSLLRGSSAVVDVPAPPFETPHEAMEAYRAAWASGNFEAYRAIWAPDGWDRGISGAPLSPEKLRERYAAGSGVKTGRGETVCEALTDLTVECSWTRTKLELTLISDEDTIDVTQSFTITDDGFLATASSQSFEFSAGQRAALQAMDAWLDSEYPDINPEFGRIWLYLELNDRPAEEFRADYEAAIKEYAATLEGR